MREQIQATEYATEMYGLTAAQVSVVEQSRLADAVAILEQDKALKESQGASELELETIQKRIEFLREELVLRGNLSDSLSKKEGKQYEMEDLQNKLKQVNDFGVQAAKNIQDAFADFLFDPFKDGVDGMLRGFVDMVRKMLAEAIAANIAKQLFGDMGKTGNIGGLVGSAITAFGFHEGGIVSSSGNDSTFSRNINPSVFLNARRYHNGGLVGDEVPAILKPGEMVLTKEQQKGMSGGRQSQQNIRIVNAFDNSVISDYMGSAAGEKVIMNAVRRNQNAFKQAVA
jgi:hypothetical protein